MEVVTAVVAFVTDLMDRSRLGGLGEVRWAREPEEAAGGDVVVVDLARFAGSVAAIRRAAPDARIVAFGSHVERETLERARAEGADEAVPRSRFFTDPRRICRPDGPATP